MMTPINMLAIDLAKGSFQVCATAQDGRFHITVLSNGPAWHRYWP